LQDQSTNELLHETEFLNQDVAYHFNQEFSTVLKDTAVD
jgi:hypothetical protein